MKKPDTIWKDWIIEYSPYVSQTGKEIPAYEILATEGPDDVLFDTREDQPAGRQLAYAATAVYCHNEFMTMLAMLQRTYAVLSSAYPDTDGRHPDRMGLTKLIHRLERME